MTIRTRLALGCILLMVLLILANLVGGPMNQLFLMLPGIDKVGHFAFYVSLFVLLRALAATLVPDSWATPLAAGVGLAIGGGDELIQGVVSTRNTELGDFAADVSGLAIGWVISQKPGRAVGLAVAGAAIIAASAVTIHTHIRLRDYSRALRYERQRDFVQAREYYLRALASGLRTPGLYNGLGWVEIESGHGDPRKAVEYSRTALEMRPGDADFLDTYGWALVHAGQSAEALAPLQEAYRKKPSMYCIHFHLGMAYRALGRRSEAETHFRRQMELTDTREARLARQALAEMNGN
jgi:Tfp pilus assembly protein PilF/VanZ family protein